MDPGDVLAAHPWPLVIGVDGALFVAAAALWIRGDEPVAMLLGILASILPLSIIAVLVDGA